jgi:hypothetical protein
MRMPPPTLAALALCPLLLFACGGGKPRNDASCQHNFDCPAGQGCIDNACQALPCGGCQPEEACGTDGNCAAAQGASCADHTCPAGYPCNSGGRCSKVCTLNQDCDPGFVCNSALHSCAECSFDTQCAGKAVRPVCDSASGACVACNVNFDCVKALGTGHYCDAHACKVGCKDNNDCNAGLGETCDTSTAPGKCIQCHTKDDCAAFGGTPACDGTGHCVQCAGSTQAEANTFCGQGQSECNLATKTCVQCLPANNASGADCGYLNGGAMDPHDAQTCNPSTLSCTAGCQFDSQCGCPRNAPGGLESDCLNPDGTTHRFPDQEHCDPRRTTMAGVAGPTIGACVQCTQNAHCEYKINGTTQYGGAYAELNGARCFSDSCVEGCDTDTDCWPADSSGQRKSNGRICHQGGSSDPNNHKCVECQCDVPGADPSYCEVKASGARACADGEIKDVDGRVTSTYPKVCDSEKLMCRKKRQGEECSASNECGDTHDPTIGLCIATPSICVYHSHSGATTGGETYCAAGSQPFGRCGVPCDDFPSNYCTGTTHCPTNSSCRQATGEDLAAGHVGAYCVDDRCNCTVSACP